MKFARLSVLSASLAIAACSGGGEFGGTFGGGGSSATTYVITSANATTAARASWEAALNSGNFGGAGGVPGLSASTPGDFSKATRAPGSSVFLVNVMQKVPFGPVEELCFVSGSITTSGDVADPLTLTTGDTFQVVSDACDGGFGEVVNGTIDFTVREFTGDLLAGTYLLSMDTVLTDFQVATESDTIVSNGDVTLTLDTTDTPFIEAGVSGTRMTVDYNAISETLSNYVSNQTLDGGDQALPFTMTGAGTLNSSELNGIIQYSTPVIFAGVGFEYPSSGSLLVEGKDSAARLTAVDNVNITIEVDTNGDGTWDETIETTWAELAAS